MLLVNTGFASPISFAFWLQCFSLISLVLSFDGLRVGSGFPYSWVLCLVDTDLGYQWSHLSFPLQALMASRKPGGDAVTPAPGGRVFHPHGLSVVMVLMAFASITKPAIL